MDVTFTNITVTVSGAHSAKDAYERLSNVLYDLEWTSDRFIEGTDYLMPDLWESRDTGELF